MLRNKLLAFSAAISKKVAIKSCSVISTLDTYQPVRPKAVMKAARANKSKNN